MPIMGHLEELRRRLMVVAIAVIVGVLISFYFIGDVVDFLLKIPEEVIIISPAEAFFAHIRLAIVAGIVVTLPITIYQIIAFLLPGLSPRERIYLLLGLPSALFLFAIGVIFAYIVILPLAYDFFMTFAAGGIDPSVTLGNYISFIKGLLLPFGVVFQLPLMVLLLTGIGIITPDFLKRNRKIVLLIVFLLAAFLTPPDVVSQAFMAGPLLLLYEISIVISGLAFRRRSTPEVLKD